MLADPDAEFKLVHSLLGTILDETRYYFVSNREFTPNNGTGSLFLNQGTLEPATVYVFHRGAERTAEQCPPLTVWRYRSIPLQDPGNAVPISTNHKPGQLIIVDTSQPGNFLFTFSISNEANPAPASYPPKSYSTFMNPPFITKSPSISLRILPNYEDFGQYYVDASAEDPVANDLLTFEVVYEKVLRTDYLLYPVMIPYVQLNSVMSPGTRRLSWTRRILRYGCRLTSCHVLVTCLPAVPNFCEHGARKCFLIDSELLLQE